MSVKQRLPVRVPLFTSNITCEFQRVVKCDRPRFLLRGPA